MRQLKQVAALKTMLYLAYNYQNKEVLAVQTVWEALKQYAKERF